MSSCQTGLLPLYSGPWRQGRCWEFAMWAKKKKSSHNDFALFTTVIEINFCMLSPSQGLTPRHSGRAQYPINQAVWAGEVLPANLQGQSKLQQSGVNWSTRQLLGRRDGWFCLFGRVRIRGNPLGLGNNHGAGLNTLKMADHSMVSSARSR
jgi:hypothetical protein